MKHGFMALTLLLLLASMACAKRSATDTADTDTGFDLFAGSEVSRPLQQSIDEASWMVVNVLHEGDMHQISIAKVWAVNGHYVRIGPLLHRVANSQRMGNGDGAIQAFAALLQGPLPAQQYPSCLCGPEFRIHVEFYNSSDDRLGVVALAPNHESTYLLDETQDIVLRHGLGHGERGPVSQLHMRISELLETSAQ